MNRLPSLFSICALCAICGSNAALAADPGPWATYRGNPQRTGNTDKVAGPDKPALLWTVKSHDQFLASPVPVKDGIYVAGLGALNRPFSVIYPLTGKTNPPEPVWEKSQPSLQLNSVSSPALADGTIVFGEGTHLDGAGLLNCFDLATTRPLWQLKLSEPKDAPVHVEGAPVVVGGKVFVGGGAAGVVCVELDKAVLDGKEYDRATVAKMQAERWKQIQTKFEDEKAKKVDGAFPPDDSQLLKFQPKKVWQKGEVRWHVDASLNFAADKLLVPTAHLEKEKIGERALYALKADTGETAWKADLKYNPWGGATVAGDLVIVPGSSIGYYYKELRGAKGNVTALDLKTGAEKWRKEIPTGGVLGCVAVADGLAVCTATDGKVRAYKVGDGERAWLYDAKAPLFAPPAVVGGVAYAADLAGVVHAIDLKTGAARWTFSVSKETGLPGMVYGGVTVHGGKLIVATCNIDGPSANKETVLVCIGTK
ncbi:MAG TPA: PQQ-binding-like beta-propeller repeat protein [Gemmata sp.]